jgi:soluble lytic murein transglycosylase-like protein
LRLLLCSLVLFSVSLSLSASPRYDLAFKHWGEVYFPSWDWRWFKAQGVAESGLNQAAVGTSGELGVMQLMADTGRYLGVDRTDWESNIRGGIEYDRQMWDRWGSAATSADRRELMFASYNAGPGNIDRASALAACSIWSRIAKVLNRVTGSHAAGTVSYVAGIEQWMRAQ